MNIVKQVGRLEDHIRVTQKKNKQLAVLQVKEELIKLLDTAKETQITDLDTYLRNNFIKYEKK